MFAVEWIYYETLVFQTVCIIFSNEAILRDSCGVWNVTGCVLCVEVGLNVCL